jgi:hypothetical protein
MVLIPVNQLRMKNLNFYLLFINVIYFKIIPKGSYETIRL